MSLTTSETTEAVCLISQIVGKSSGSVGGREEWAFPSGGSRLVTSRGYVCDPHCCCCAQHTCNLDFFNTAYIVQLIPSCCGTRGLERREGPMGDLRKAPSSQIEVDSPEQKKPIRGTVRIGRLSATRTYTQHDARRPVRVVFLCLFCVFPR